MKTRASFNTHITVLSALFILGDAIIIYPKSGTDGNSLWGYLLGFVIITAGFFVVSFLSFRLLSKKGRLRHFVLIALFPVISAGAFYSAVKSFLNFTNLVDEVVLRSVPVYIIAAVFLLSLSYFVSKRQENVLKFALVTGTVAIIILLFFFIIGLKRYDVRHSVTVSTPEISGVLKQTVQFIFNPIMSSFLLPLYYIFVFDERKLAPGLAGALMGYMLLGLFAASTVLLFGIGLSGDIKYPFSAAVGTLTVGRLFTRLDGLSYFVFFICSTVKINVCIYTGYRCLKEISLSFGKK